MVALTAAALLLLTACGEEPSSGADRTDPSETPAPPTKAPAGEVMTRFPATVLDDGDGPELCLGAVAESYPPQCGGPALVGWDWAEFDGHFEEAHGVRWGGFHVVGSYDGGGHDGTFTVTEVTPADEWDGELPAPEVDFTTPCPEPDGGWQVADPARTTAAAQEEAFRVAQGLEGYAGGWIDQPAGPPTGPVGDPDGDRDAEDDAPMGDSAPIVNIRVVGDTAAAEVELRRVWGGPLCVTEAERTEAELRAIQDEVNQTPGLLSAGTDIVAGTVYVDVIYDDGTLQAGLDEQYGEGVVRVDSALVPAP